MSDPADVTGLTATATCTAFAGADEDGVLVAARDVAERVAWMSVIVQDMTERLVAEHWNTGSLTTLSGKTDEAGKKLPANGWMALRRLGWVTTAPEGVIVSDRVRRIAEEHAARLLRLAVHRDLIITAIVATWPADPVKGRTDVEWKALWAALPSTVSPVEARNRIRQVRDWQKEHGRLPSSVCEAEEPPRVSGQVLLAAAERQQVTMDRDLLQPGFALLRVKLPSCAQPTRYQDWQWLILSVRLTVTVPDDASLHTPTLRIVGSLVRVDVPWTIPVPAPRRDGHRRALGLDWGYNTLLTGVVGRLGEDRRGRPRVVANTVPLNFDASGMSAKIMRLRMIREQLKAKTVHQDRLLAGRESPALLARRDLLTAEHEHVCARLRRTSHALAWAAARWAVDHAIDARCTVIYIEDLTSMQAGGLSRSWNRRLGGHIRGQVAEALRHLAAKAGITVVDVPARGTSSGCPRCPANLRHVKSPDLLTVRGHKWAYCPSCHLSCDRDYSAAQRILGRGLLGQHLVRRDKAGRLHTTRAVDAPVRLVRDKQSATPRRPRRPQIFRPTPLRRRVPAIPAPITAAQRPAGRPPQVHDSPVVGQVPFAKPNGHQPQGRRLGRGFHLHVTATPMARTCRPVPRLNIS